MADTQAQQTANTRNVLARLRSLGNTTKSRQKKVADKVPTPTNIREQTTTIQSGIGNVGLGEATKAAQQALSEKYGIPTFDKAGNISTVPQTRPIDHSINVGTGRFTPEAFHQSLEIIIQNQQKPVENKLDIFDVFVVKPVTEFFESLFTEIDISQLTRAQQIEIDKIDAEIRELERQIEQVGKDFPQLQPKTVYVLGRETFDYTAINAQNKLIEERKKPLRDKINELLAKKDEMIKRFITGSRVEEEIRNRIERSEVLLNVDGLTHELKTEIEKLVEENRSFVNKVTSEAIEVTDGLLDELVEVTFSLFQKAKQEITETQNEAKSNLLNIQSLYGQFVGFAEGIGNGFKEAFNPSQEVTNEIAVKTMLAQLTAQKQITEGLKN